MLKNRSLAGKWAIGVFVLTLVLVVVAFGSQNWLASDVRFYGSKLEKMGLWVHCFRSLSGPNDPTQHQFFSGCRWLFDTYTTGYADIRSHLTPRKYYTVSTGYHSQASEVGDSGTRPLQSKNQWEMSPQK